MHFEGSVEINAPRDTVWAFVIDPDQVGQCGPGVESIEVIDDTHFKVVGQGRDRVHQRPLRGEHGVRRADAAGLCARSRRTARRPGSAVDATAQMHLSDGPSGGTVMDWSADVNIAGTLASVGARLIEGTANKMIGQTFSCMKTRLEDTGA